MEISLGRHTAVGKLKVKEASTYRGVRLAFILCEKTYFYFNPMLQNFSPGIQSWNE